jgi:hypothetical protein
MQYLLSKSVFNLLTFCMVVTAGVSLEGATVRIDEIGGEVTDLVSDDPSAPTRIEVEPGVNRIIGQVSQAVGDIWDFVTFTIEPGEVLESILLVEYDDPELDGLGDGNRGWIHLDDGVASVIPDSSNGGTLLGGNHLDRVIYPTATTNILTDLSGGGLAGTGFSQPLGPGDYVLNVQQTGPQLTQYTIDLVIREGAAQLPSVLSGSVFLGDRWISDWFGAFALTASPNIIFSFDHGFIYLLEGPETTTGFWFWDYGLGDWIYTSQSLYPILYNANLGWLYWAVSTDELRWFYVYNTGQFTSLSRG